jgi:hypothetical protein
MTRASGSKPSEEATINRAIERLGHEARGLRQDMAALKALGRARESVSPLMSVISNSLQSDVLARLIRVLDRDSRVRSFWFLHRRGILRADRATIACLSNLANRLITIRVKVFMHIDEDGLHDPQKPYREADIDWLSEIEPAITTISEIVARLYEERLGRPYTNTSIADFQEIFDRDLRRFGKA